MYLRCVKPGTRDTTSLMKQVSYNKSDGTSRPPWAYTRSDFCIRLLETKWISLHFWHLPTFLEHPKWRQIEAGIKSTQQLLWELWLTLFVSGINQLQNQRENSGLMNGCWREKILEHTMPYSKLWKMTIQRSTGILSEWIKLNFATFYPFLSLTSQGRLPTCGHPYLLERDLPWLYAIWPQVDVYLLHNEVCILTYMKWWFLLLSHYANDSYLKLLLQVIIIIILCFYLQVTRTSLSFLYRISRQCIGQIVPETCAIIYKVLKDQYLKVRYCTE